MFEDKILCRKCQGFFGIDDVKSDYSRTTRKGYCKECLKKWRKGYEERKLKDRKGQLKRESKSIRSEK